VQFRAKFSLHQRLIATSQAMLASGKLPPPVNDHRCKECSLNELCQPGMLAETGRQHEMAVSLYEVEE